MKDQESRDQLGKNRQGIYVGIVLAISIVIATLLVVFKPQAEKKIIKDEPPLAEFVVAVAESISIPVTSQGSVVASQSIGLVAEVSGKVKIVSAEKFKAGKFNKGDLLLQIDDADYQLALTRSQANVASAEQKLARVKVEAEQAKYDLQRMGRDESASTDYALKKPHLIEAQANLKAAEADFELARLQLQRTRVSAPFDGRVSKKYVDQGQYVVSGSLLADIYSIESVEINLPLSLRQIQLLGIELSEGRSAGTIQAKLISEFSGVKYEWPAKFSHLESQLDARSRLIDLVVKVDKPFDQASQLNVPPLTPGMFVRAVLAGATKEKVFSLPRAALRAANELWIVNQDEQLEKRTVTLYGKDASVIYVKSGVQSGERIIINAIDFPVDKMPLQAKLAVSEQHPVVKIK